MESIKNPTRFFGTRHVQVLLLFIGNIIMMAIRSCMSVAIVAMTNKESSEAGFPTFNWDPQTQSYILSSLLWGTVVAQLPMSILVRQGGSHKLLSYGLLICSIMCTLIPISAIQLGWTAVLICRILMGIGQGCVIPCLIMLLTKWVPPAERASMGSLVLNSAQLGNVLSLALSGVLAGSSLGWPSIFYTLGTAGIVWCVAFYWLGADSPSTHKWINPEEKKYIESSLGCSDDDVMNTKMKIPWKAISTSLPVWSLLIAKSAHIWSYYMILSELPTYMKNVLNFEILESGAISSIPYIAKWLFAFPIGWASDFALRKGTSIALGRKISNSIGMWGPALSLLILGLLRTTDQTLAVTLLILAVGLNAGTMCGVEINEIDICPNFSGIVATITNSAGKIFGIVAPIAFGLIVTDLKNLDQWLVIFYISVAQYFVGNLIFVIFGKGEVQYWNDQSPTKQPWDNPSSPKLSIQENVVRARLSTISRVSNIQET